MPEIKLRYNENSEEVELLVDNEVALTSGNDVFVSWVEAYNEKHKPEEPEIEKEVNEEVPEQVEEETSAEEESDDTDESESGQEV